ncbi:MAG: chemotaxis protein CheA [Chrysiogenetes bacterium]|nr:chemotaxis protein CheA [Chrysiogenetes bacterium]
MGDEKLPTEKELLEVFRRETEEQVERAESALLTLEREPLDGSALKTLFRSIHSIKGNAAVVGRQELERFSHSLEDALHPIREAERIVTPALAEPVFAALYAIRDAALSGDGELPFASIAVISDLVGKAPLPEDQTGRYGYRMTLQYPGEVLPEAFEPRYIFDDLSELGTVVSCKLDPSSVLPLDRLKNPDALSLRYVVELESDKQIDEIREGCFVFDDSIKVIVEPLQDSAPTPNAIKAVNGDEKLAAVRIDTYKLDNLMNLAGELNVSNLRVRRMVEEGASSQEVLDALEQLSQHARAMQDQILSTRMINIDELFRPFIRLVREMSAGMGKRIELSLSGSEVELDKSIVERMREPLTHIIRNAVDHGIESPADRVSAGKDVEARISIRAEQREGSIYLTIEDDGRGIDREKLRRKAIDTGLLDESIKLSNEQIDALIFESGLSTAEKITNISGRGVGMDIVRKKIEQIRGEVHIENHPGKGVTIRIRLPLTLAIIEGFMVSAGGEIFIIPIHAISECIDLTEEQRESAERTGVLNLRGEPVAFAPLRNVFHTGGAKARRQQILLVRYENHRAALVVDEVLGEGQTIIKPLGKMFERVPGISGSSILWDGKVALIIDVPALFQLLAERGYLGREDGEAGDESDTEENLTA